MNKKKQKLLTNKNFFKKLILLFIIANILNHFDILIYDSDFKLNGVFTINSKMNEDLYFSDKNMKLILERKNSQFDITYNYLNSYNLISRKLNKIVGIDRINNEEIVFYNKKEFKNNEFILWNFILIENNQYIIQNNYNKKYIRVSNSSLIFDEINATSLAKKNIDSSFKFRVLKLFETIKKITKRELIKIEKEPIDVFIKYIDLTDKTLNRSGIKQIYKDEDNEELKYSLRSIFQYIPWVRKIFIVMPNKKVKFLKSYDEIKEKIIYINDKEFLGYDSANIFAFTFNLYKMEKFGISKNFIYMEDDYFFGKPLKKSDFFYYDKKVKQIFPYVLTSSFKELDKNKTLKLYFSEFKKKDKFKFQGLHMWDFSILSTEKYFIEKYNRTIINTRFTHCARAENLNDLKDMFKSIQNYKYINETLYSKIRHILSLNQPHYNNLFQLNIKHRKVNSIHHKYIEMEKVKEDRLYYPLFVINTGGENIPTKKEYANQRKVMQKRYPIPIKYEI